MAHIKSWGNLRIKLRTKIVKKTNQRVRAKTGVAGGKGLKDFFSLSLGEGTSLPQSPLTGLFF